MNRDAWITRGTAARALALVGAGGRHRTANALTVDYFYFFFDFFLDFLAFLSAFLSAFFDTDTSSRARNTGVNYSLTHESTNN